MTVGTFEPVIDRTGRTRVPDPRVIQDPAPEPERAYEPPRRISPGARRIAFALIAASVGLAVAGAGITVVRHMHVSAPLTAPEGALAPAAATPPAQAAGTDDAPRPSASPSPPVTPASASAVASAPPSAAPLSPPSLASAPPPHRPPSKPHAPATPPLAQDYDGVIAKDRGGASSSASTPHTAKPAPKAAPSASAHDDIDDWLEKPKKPSPGPGF
jgi:hypothetical protein